MSDMDNKFRERGLSLFTDTPPQSPPCQGGDKRGGRIGTVPENTMVSGREAEKGFTLIEVLIITAIVGVLTTIAVMNFGGIIDSYKARGAASNLFADMQMARLKAVKEGKEWAVQFSGNSYSVRNKGADGTWGNADDVIIKAIDLASEYSGVTANSSGTGGLNSGREIFYPNGTASSGIDNPTWAKVIISKGSRIQSVCIRSSTGNIRIVNGSSCS